ncbi:MAG: four helix bundle protein [Chloracidobacterium sp.]|nr:four helix bundle protein [Chloracidobacterium sp.]
MKDFRKLTVWEKSHQLTLELYSATRTFPKEELFGLTSQIRRAAASIPANIAEGCGKGSDADFSRFLQISFGSACELEYHLILSKDLELLSDPVYIEINNELVSIKKMLASLISKIKANR